jgi:penicillin-binding protein 1B
MPIKKTIFQWLKISLISGLIILFLLCLFIYNTINNAKSDLSRLESKETLILEKNKSHFEQGSLARLEDIKIFYNFSHAEIPFDEWLADLKDNQVVEIDEKSGEVTFNQALEIPSLVQNDCREAYCFQHVVGFEKIPSTLWKGLIGIEDLRFVTHSGVDFKSILRAIIVDLREMRMAQGGSTITQQLIKNVFLTGEKSLIRKLKEIVLSIYIETQFTKEEILTTYFNEVFWGSIQGIKVKGVYAAALMYFGKKAEDLTDYETTILVSLLKGPNYYSPLTKWERLKQRADLVYEKLVELNLFAQDFSAKWKIDRYQSWTKKLKHDQTNRLVYSLWMGQDDKQSVLDQFDRFVFMKSGLKILNKVQELSLDKDDLAFKAMVSMPFCKDCPAPQYFYSKIERDKTRAIENEKHQAGSTIKPLLYDIFYRLGKSPQDLIETKSITLKLKSGNWTPKDSSKTDVPLISLEEALLKSRNIPLIRVAQELGFENIETNLKDYLPELKTPLKEYPSQLLGAFEISLKQMSDTYSMFIKEECGRVRKGEKEFRDIVLAQLSDPTRNTLSNVVGERLAPMRFFAKTGTTNNALDNWLIVFDGKYLYVIWFGVEGNRVGKKYHLSGATSAFRIFQEFVSLRGKRFVDISCDQMIL